MSKIINSINNTKNNNSLKMTMTNNINKTKKILKSRPIATLKKRILKKILINFQGVIHEKLNVYLFLVSIANKISKKEVTIKYNK